MRDCSRVWAELKSDIMVWISILCSFFTFSMSFLCSNPSALSSAKLHINMHDHVYTCLQKDLCDTYRPSLTLCVCVSVHLFTDLLCLCLWSCSSFCAFIAFIRSLRSSFSLFSSCTSLLFSSSCLSNDCKRFCCFRS